MSTEEQAETEEAAEPGVMSERTAKIVLLTVGFLAMWGIVAVLPETAYFVAGIMTCRGWQKARGWMMRRREGREGADEEEEPDVAAALRHLGRRGDHVLLTQLRKQLGTADTKSVRALLKESGIRVRSGVRTPAGNGPGVHIADIPAAPSQGDDSPGGGCLCRSGNNGNANNAPSETPEKGLRVERTDWGATVHDPADAWRHHNLDGRGEVKGP